MSKQLGCETRALITRPHLTKRMKSCVDSTERGQLFQATGEITAPTVYLIDDDTASGMTLKFAATAVRAIAPPSTEVVCVTFAVCVASKTGVGYQDVPSPRQQLGTRDYEKMVSVLDKIESGSGAVGLQEGEQKASAMLCAHTTPHRTAPHRTAPRRTAPRRSAPLRATPRHSAPHHRPLSTASRSAKTIEVRPASTSAPAFERPSARAPRSRI